MSSLTAVGGFAGYGNGIAFTRCLVAVGPWTSTGSRRQGFLGWEAATCTFDDCHWDTDVATHSVDVNVTGETTATLKDEETYDSEDWENWQIVDGRYPILDWETHRVSNLLEGLVA